jgi:hypothetical protein
VSELTRTENNDAPRLDTGTDKEGGQDLIPTRRGISDDEMAKYRAVLERAKRVATGVTEQDQELEELLARTNNNMANAAKAIRNATDAQDAMQQSLEQLREEVAKAAEHKLKSYRVIAAQARSSADAMPPLEDLAAAETHATIIGTVSGALLQAPSSKDTQKSQGRLLAASAITLLLSSGLSSLDGIPLGGVTMKFDATKMVWAAVATGIACLYFLITFLQAYYRDLQIGHVLRANSVIRLRPTWKRIVDEYAVILEAHVGQVAELEVPGQSPAALVTAFDKVTNGERRLEAIRHNITLVSGLLHRAQTLPRLRLWVEVLLPSVIALIALGVCLRFVLIAFNVT